MAMDVVEQKKDVLPTLSRLVHFVRDSELVKQRQFHEVIHLSAN
jgi:hypothetical protein